MLPSSVTNTSRSPIIHPRSASPMGWTWIAWNKRSRKSSGYGNDGETGRRTS